jgi:hypothetical protein
MKTIINYDRYPIADREARDVIVARARQQLADSGSAAFPEFVLPEALQNMLMEGLAKHALAYRRNQELTINGKGDAPQTTGQEAVLRTSPYRMWVLGSDLLSPEGAIRQLYSSDDMRNLVRESVDVPSLFAVADPLIDVNLTYMGDGDQHGWHFDDNDFVVSLILQLPDDGGAFEYAPGAWGLGANQIDNIMNGRSDLTRTQLVAPGTLLVFRGSRALHRVTPVKGDKRRIIALLSYHTQPGFVFPALVKKNSLGRSMSVHEPVY